MKSLTEAQLRVVLANDGHLLVSAGAGSGKTTTVVQKICYLLGAVVRDASGAEHHNPQPLSLGEIAAITYTNHAAADLKRKLRAALVAAGMPEQAVEVDTARIGTIHAFCGDTLRDFALRAGLSPSLRVLDDAQASVITADAARSVLHRAAEASSSALARLLRGRRIIDMVGCVSTLSEDAGRLAAWNENAQMLREHERTLLELANAAAAEREAALVHAGGLDFNRMITATRDMLQRDAGVRHAVQRGLRVLVVDEFQDVDPAQRDIAMSLGGMTESDPIPTRVVFVGDPKQSIYRFRRADVSLWNDVERRFRVSGVGTVLPLSDNFRSRRGILALVDDLVGSLFVRKEGAERRSFEVDYAPLEARWEHADGDECVELLCVPAGTDGKPRKADETRALEAQGVARRIAELYASGTGYGDIALLLTGWGALDIYESALRAAGIPAYALRTEGFWETREVVDCLLALRVIRDARDEVAMVGFLKSPFVGVRDETLLACAEARRRAVGGTESAVDALGDAMLTDPGESSLLDRATRMLGRFSALRDRIPVHELITRLVEESGFLAAMQLDPAHGRQAVANIRKLVRFATAAPDASLGEFLRGAADSRVRGDKIGEERLYRERAGVVTITSVHSAKGLEWPVVFWCDLVRDAPQNASTLLCGRDVFRLRDLQEIGADGEKIPDLEHAALLEEIRLEATAESYRLWYVAATRPQQLLVLSGVPLGSTGTEPPELPKSVSDLVRRRFRDNLLNGEIPTSIAYSSSSGDTFRIVVRMADAEIHPAAATRWPDATEPHIDIPPDVISAPSGRARLSATQLMLFQHDPQRWWERYVFGFETPGDAMLVPGGRHGGGRARDVGVVVHDVLERYGFELVDIAELVELAIVRHDVHVPDAGTESGAGFRDAVRAIVTRATRHPDWKAVAEMPSARRELSFTRVLADGSTVEGAFDLAAITPVGIRILDAKSTAARPDELAARYAVQGAVYTSIASAITGVSPASFALVTPSADSALNVPCDGVPGLPELVQRVRDHQLGG